MQQYIMAIDAGTTSARAILFDHTGTLCAMAQQELTLYYPQEGWVEQDALELWQEQLSVCRAVLQKAGVTAEQLAAIGITNQRETTIVWDKKTGKPIAPAIVWQCRRTAAEAEALRSRGLEELLHERTGLITDAYFSATKLAWLLDHTDGARERAERGELLFGTVDCWLIWKLTAGKRHVTDVSNAARTMLFDIHHRRWDEEILHELNIPACMLPEVVSSSGIAAETKLFGCPVPIAGIAGDQQAALFGQNCFTAGEAKNTYGTGCFLLMNTGNKPVLSENGLLTTIAWEINGELTYALEGSVFVAGAVLQWLRDELHLLKYTADSEPIARSVDSTGGVMLVPAFTGLGAPYWDPYARGTIVGLTRGTKAAHIVRAALESLAYQTADVLHVMEKDAGILLRSVKADGGASANDFLMEFQADIVDVPIVRPECVETTAMGAAFLAGLAVGFWESQEELCALAQTAQTFSPSMDAETRKKRMSRWHRAVECSMGWSEAE